MVKLPFFIGLGEHDKEWYKETEQLFVRLYGLNKLPLVTQLFAATSINSTLKSNVRLFRKAYHEMENNLPFSNYLPNIKIQLEHIRAGRPMSGRKITNFAAAMSGDFKAVVVDKWLLRAFDYPNDSATKKQYDFIEAWVIDYAFTHGYAPREVSAMIWSGVRIHFTGSKLTRYDKILEQQEFNMFNYAISKRG